MNAQPNEQQIYKVRVCWRKHGRIKKSTIQNKIREATSNESQNVRHAIARAFEREEVNVSDDDDNDFIVLYDEQQPIIRCLTKLNSADITACGKKLYFVCFSCDLNYS